jgi:hypothetical protein
MVLYILTFTFLDSRRDDKRQKIVLKDFNKTVHSPASVEEMPVENNNK